jgi:hypothetical protein
LLVLHIFTSVGLMGAVAAFLLLAVDGVWANDASASVYIAMDLIARLIILPLTAATLVIGVVQSLATTWGLLRHWWVVAKLVLTIFTLVVLTLQMKGIRLAADMASQRGSISALQELPSSFILHATGGLLVLSAALVLSVYKPKGRTRWGGPD